MEVDYGNFIAGVALAVFLGFLASKLGYLSVHKKAPRPPSGGSSGGSRTKTHMK